MAGLFLSLEGFAVRVRLNHLVLLVVALLMLAGCDWPMTGIRLPLPSDGSTGGTQRGMVVHVADGDTIWVRIGDDEFKVRYIGIDAPELARDGSPAESWAEASRERNRALVLGREVELVRDILEVDRYGRLLRHVYVDDVWVNELLVREGLARAHRYPPDITHQNALDAAQAEARAERRGIWSE